MTKGNPNDANTKPNFCVKVWDDKTQSYRPIYVAADATAAVQGEVWLSDAIDSTEDAASGVTAATPKAVKEAYDLAKEAFNKTPELVTTEHDGLIKMLPGDENLFFNGMGVWDRAKGFSDLYMFEVDENGDLYQLYFNEDDIQEFQLDPNGDFWAVFDEAHKLFLGNLRDGIVKGFEQGGTGASTREDAVANLLEANAEGPTTVGTDGTKTDWWYQNSGTTVITTIANNTWLPAEVTTKNDLSNTNPGIVFSLPFKLLGVNNIAQVFMSATSGLFFRISHAKDTWSAWSSVGPAAVVSVGKAGLAPGLPS